MNYRKRDVTSTDTDTHVKGKEYVIINMPTNFDIEQGMRKDWIHRCIERDDKKQLSVYVTIITIVVLIMRYISYYYV